MEGSTARHIDEGPAGGEIDPAVLDARLDAEITDAADALRAAEAVLVLFVSADVAVIDPLWGVYGVWEW